MFGRNQSRQARELETFKVKNKEGFKYTLNASFWNGKVGGVLLNRSEVLLLAATLQAKSWMQTFGD